MSKLARGTGTTLFGSAFGKGLFFLTQLLLAWLLGVEQFGLYSLGLALVKIADIVARLGLNVGGMRFVSVYKDESQSRLKGVIWSAVGLSFLNGTLIGAIIYVTAPIVSGFLFHKPELTSFLSLFALSVPVVSAMTTLASVLQGFHTTKFTVLVRDFIQPAANVLFIVLAAFFGHRLEGAIWAFSFSHLAGLAAGIYCIKRVSPAFFSRSLKAEFPLKELVIYSMPLLFVGFLHYFLNWTDTLMLGAFSSSKEVGIYRAAAQIPFIMTVFLGATNSIYAPIIADLYQKLELQRLGDMLKTTTRWVTYVTVPLFMIIVFSAQEIMSLFGKDFVETGSTVLVILSFGQLINCVTGGVGYTLTMTGKQNIELGNSLGLVFLSIVLNMLLIPDYGAHGAAVASSISIILINVLRVVEIYRMYGTLPFSPIMVPLFIPMLLSFVCLLVFNLYSRSYLTFVLKICTVIIIFTFTLCRSRVAQEDIYIISVIKSRLFRKYC